jgi:hypothetical protein
VVIIYNGAGIVDLEQGIEFIGEEGRRKEEADNDWEI